MLNERINNNPMPRHGQHNGKEEKMFNSKVIVALLVVVFVGLVSALNITSAEVQKININTASAEELAQLKGIGPSHAAKIVAYREKNGPFKLPEELVQVSGIGQKTFEANQEIIIVEEPKPKKK
jgi:competence protein ComEA